MKAIDKQELAKAMLPKIVGDAEQGGGGEGGLRGERIEFEVGHLPVLAGVETQSQRRGEDGDGEESGGGEEEGERGGGVLET